ncbi:4508_t:CDS:2 [Scutellospora calospora]|uniref:4508_t:CDS:1 n=1 Tax=Scutellospora calospora TaxID=85575 RepID=A0ACA9KR10_9GLOM|nr:4508_t:CDS:2 [Scutellospora calospora]
MTIKDYEGKVSLEHSSGSSTEGTSVLFIYLSLIRYGLELLELLVNSLPIREKSKLDGTKAIRGGIPLIFPQFAKASEPSAETANLPQHGIARVSTWKFLGAVTDNEEEVSARFGLTDAQVPENFHKEWPKKFELIFTVTLTANTLKNTLEVRNNGTEPFEFNALLHTYYSVPISIKGLNEVTYLDKVNNFARIRDVKDSITIDQETDRIYMDVPKDEFIIDLGQPDGVGNFTLKKLNLKDTVVWNPWIKKALEMSDFGDDEYKKMVCVEPGTVTEYVKLEAGKTWECGQIIKVFALKSKLTKRDLTRKGTPKNKQMFLTKDSRKSKSMLLKREPARKRQLGTEAQKPLVGDIPKEYFLVITITTREEMFF